MIGAVLAGGVGSRLGRGSKPAALLGGRPLIEYPLAALAGVCERLAVVCKRATRLPELPGAERWEEPDKPRHPLTGIVHALETAGAPVLVCAADMPFVTADACRTLMQGAGGSPAVVATAAGVLQPTFGLYAPAALDELRAAPPDTAAHGHGRGARTRTGGTPPCPGAQRQHAGGLGRGGGAAGGGLAAERSSITVGLPRAGE